MKEIQGCKLFELDRFEDDRGYFQEIYNDRKFTLGQVPQVSFSTSHCDVLRGIHISPYGKFCTCVRGSIFEVVVDLRKYSNTYLQYTSIELSENNKRQLFIPAFCGHAFLSLEDNSSLLYLQGGVWSDLKDKGLIWNDSKINIEWPKPINGKYIISEKDLNQPSFDELIL